VELDGLERVLLFIPLRLRLLVLAVAADEAQEDVVCDWAQRGERVEEAGAD
jgi:hypothetical protein